MQNKEQVEDEELLEEFREDEDQKHRFSGEDSEMDQADIDGTDGVNLKRNKEQIEGYEEDENADDNASQSSKARSGHAFAEENMEIEEFDDNVSQKTKSSKIDIGSKLSNFKPFLQQINFFNQEKEPEFKRAKIVITIHLNLDANKTKLNKILMLSLVEAILQKVLIRSVKGINKSYVIERQIKGSNSKEKVIQTEGINFEECYNNAEIFDLNRIETNNINDMMKHYGIEAARYCIVKEVRGVFDVYGIEVDYRHLSLVADFMTQNGTYKPFNRIGMNDSNSPFLKASFETSTAFLSDSCVRQDFDNNTTPSASIVLGQVPKIGTGVFDLYNEPTFE